MPDRYDRLSNQIFNRVATITIIDVPSGEGSRCSARADMKIVAICLVGLTMDQARTSVMPWLFAWMIAGVMKTLLSYYAMWQLVLRNCAWSVNDPVK